MITLSPSVVAPALRIARKRVYRSFGCIVICFIDRSLHRKIFGDDASRPHLAVTES